MRLLSLDFDVNKPAVQHCQCALGPNSLYNDRHQSQSMEAFVQFFIELPTRKHMDTVTSIEAITNNDADVRTEAIWR